MSRISRLVVLATSMAAVVGALAGTASALTWHVSGTGSFAVTGPQVTLSATNSNLVCPSSSGTGTYTAGSFAGATYSGVTGSFTYLGCSLAGQNTSARCGYALTLTAQPTVTVVTTGTMDLTCDVTLFSSIKICHVEGTAPAIYTNNAIGADTLVIATSSTLRSTGLGCVLGPNDFTHIAATVYTVTSNGGNGPHIVRTP
ncbi:hypothetical protein [Baekduia sp. Peel2402]|uniref:hypothetical protein n=1 Tax=Baekduia sp. Peel2402 TaxID=3458296 RepID=UPI00403E71ED